MKNKILLVPILTFILLIFSCKKGEKAFEEDYINTIVNKISISNRTKAVVILPGLGCEGCIQEGEVFLRDHISNKEVFFVLTKIESLKILQNKLDIEIKENSNIYIDDQLGFDMRSNNSIYPCIVYLDNGNIRAYEFQSPGNSAFEKLRSQISFAQ